MAAKMPRQPHLNAISSSTGDAASARLTPSGKDHGVASGTLPLVREQGSAELVANPLASPPPRATHPFQWGELVTTLRAFYEATRPYLLFSLCFVLIWLAGDLYGLRSEWHVYRVEFPFCLYLFYVFNQILRPSRWRPLLAALPVFGGYLLHDLHWFYFDDVPQLVQLNDVPELFTVGDFWLRGLLLGLAAGILWFWARLVHYNLRSLFTSLPLLLLAGAMLVTPAWVKQGVEAGVFWINPWLQVENSMINGRITTVLYNEAKRRAARAELAEHGEDETQQRYFQQVLSYLKVHAQEDRKVFLIVLESFLDPRLLAPLKGRDEYLDARFRKRYDQALGFSISPKFAGGTAQAEFELLCGVPAFEEYAKTEFNLFTGRPIPCLPQVLGQLGYDTLANYPYRPTFFNAHRAYPGLGFQETYYAQEYSQQPTYLRLEKKDTYLFDGAFYQQNRAFLESRQGGAGLFNYMLTLYGHMYFDVQRPIKWPVPTQDGYLERIVNIGYYRTGPLAEYLAWIKDRYPKSLVIVVADHLPTLQRGPDSYKDLGYLNNIQDSIYHNRLLVIEDGKPKKLPTLHHYGIPYLVYDYLTKGGFCQNFSCPTRYPFDKDLLRDRYRYLLANAVLDRT